MEDQQVNITFGEEQQKEKVKKEVPTWTTESTVADVAQDAFVAMGPSMGHVVDDDNLVQAPEDEITGLLLRHKKTSMEKCSSDLGEDCFSKVTIDAENSKQKTLYQPDPVDIMSSNARGDEKNETLSGDMNDGKWSGEARSSGRFRMDDQQVNFTFGDEQKKEKVKKDVPTWITESTVADVAQDAGAAMGPSMGDVEDDDNLDQVFDDEIPSLLLRHKKTSKRKGSRGIVLPGDDSDSDESVREYGSSDEIDSDDNIDEDVESEEDRIESLEKHNSKCKIDYWLQTLQDIGRYQHNNPGSYYDHHENSWLCSTCIHFGGLRKKGTPWVDKGVKLGISPGRAFRLHFQSKNHKQNVHFKKLFGSIRTEEKSKNIIEMMTKFRVLDD